MSLTADQYIQSMLFNFCWREAVVHGGYNNMLAIAFVIRNRVRSGWFNGDWLEILDHAHGVCGTWRDQDSHVPSMSKPEIRTVLSYIPNIYAGVEPDKMTEGALYYGELDRIDNTWFKESILAHLDIHRRVATIGPVTFFT
jgi:hypothetical protein